MKIKQGEGLKRDEYQKRMREITGNPALSLIEMNAGLSELLDELIVEEKPESKKEHRWPGMYNPAHGEVIWTIDFGGMIEERVTYKQSHVAMLRAAQLCCKTRAEAEFVKNYMDAKRDVIGRLKGLNEGWRTNEHVDSHYEIRLDRNEDTIKIILFIGAQALPDYFHAKTENIWEEVGDEFGDEKIKLAIWPKYKEANEV